MSVPAFHELKNASRHSLNTAEDPRRIILIHSGITLLASLALLLADYLLTLQIGKTGGLGSFGTQAVYETIRSVLALARSVALPFWQIGYVFYALKLAQGTDVGAPGLTNGFRRFGAVLRLRILMTGIMVLVTVVGVYISSMIFSLTPWSTALVDALAPMMEGVTEETDLMAIYQSIPLETILPLLIIMVVVVGALIIPMFYRYRMADLWLMDHPNGGALAALHLSRKMMKGNAMAVFKIDLHFWWFFGLEVLIVVLAYGDFLLQSMGISLPLGDVGAYYLFYGLSLLAHLGLYYWKQNEVSVTYAHLYEALKPAEEEKPKLWNV